MPRIFVLRDSFARFTITKERLYHPVSTCAWCGQVALFRGRRCLYQFVIEYDGGRDSPGSRLFCSYGCYSTYYGS